MKYIRWKIWPLLLLFLIIHTPYNCYSQAGIIGKTAVKGSTKNAAKSAVKTELKATTKQAVKKEIVNSSTKIAKRSAKSLTKNAIKKEVQISLEKGTSKTAREATEAVLKREARETASESLVTTTVKKAEKKTLKKAEKTLTKKGTKAATKTSATKTITKASVQDSKAIMNSAIKAEIKSISRVGGVKVAQKASTKEISMNITTESIEKALNKTAAKRWESLVKADSHTTEILLKDLEANPQLAKQFKQNPALLDVYHRNIGSPTYRTDLNLLRYQFDGANKFSEELVFLDKTTKQRIKYTGDNLKIVEKNGVNYIKDVKTDNVLGTISGTAENRMIYVEGDGQELLNLYHLGNTTYIVDDGYMKIMYKTDKQGVLIGCNSHHYKKLPHDIGKDRNKGKILRIKEIKNDYTSAGTRSSRYHNLDDDGGHIVPKSLGGSDYVINVFPQNRSMNRSGIWKKSELAAKKAIQQGKDVERNIVFIKDGNTSLRPSSVHLIQKIDGEVTVDAIIDNPKVIKR